MKHYLSIALLCGAGAASAFAQTVVVTEKDGTAHKFFAEDVKEITFETPQSADLIDYSDIRIVEYGHNFSLGFDADGKPSVALDVYTGTATYLKAATYTVAAQGTDMVIDNSDLRYTYVEKDGTKHKIESGTMTVSNEHNDYTITMDFRLDDASEFKAQYKGVLSKAQQYVSLAAVNAQQTEIRDAEPGEFYLKLNDAEWKFEMVLDLFGEPGATAIAPGSYTLADSKAAGTYSSKSTVDFYAPVNEQVKITSPVTVEADGAKTKITVEAELPDGRVYTIVFDDEVKYLDAPEPGVTVYELEGVDDVNVYNAAKGYGAMTFYGPEAEVTVEFYGAEGKPYLAEGTYTATENAGEFTVTLGAGSDTKVSTDDDYAVKGGVMTVAYEGKEAVITMEFTLENGTPFQAEFKGELPKFSKYVSIVADVMKQSDINDPKEGEIYLKFNDTDYSFEGVLDFFCAAGATSVTPGTYTLAATDAAGTYSSKSVLSTYTPNEDFRVEAPVTVARNGQITTISFTQTLEDGREISFSYSGKVEYLNEEAGADEPMTCTFDRATMETLGLEREVHFFAGSDVEVSLNFMNNSRDAGVNAGTYPVEDSGAPGTITVGNYTWANIGGTETAIVSGTVTVEKNADDYTVEMDVKLQNGVDLKGSYTGPLSEVE